MVQLGPEGYLCTNGCCEEVAFTSCSDAAVRQQQTCDHQWAGIMSGKIRIMLGGRKGVGYGCIRYMVYGPQRMYVLHAEPIRVIHRSQKRAQCNCAII